MRKLIYKLDWRALESFEKMRRPASLDTVMRGFTILGNGGTIWFMTAAIFFLIRDRRRVSLAMLFSLTLSLLIGNIILKNAIFRERPYVKNPSLQPLIKPPTDYSCPSGHAFSSFSAATVLLLFCGIAWIPALLLATIISLSRVYLLVHYPSDVVVSFILGISTGLLTFKIM